MAAKHIHVDPKQFGTRTSPQFNEEDAGPRPAASADGFCYWNDHKYSDGSTVCDSHILYECWNGKWVAVSQC